VTIDQIVSLTRVAEAGTTALNVFTVPAGRLFVLTDALLTNPGAAAACGASIAPGGRPRRRRSSRALACCASPLKHR
jgi:hypothetical protein